MKTLKQISLMTLALTAMLSAVLAATGYFPLPTGMTDASLTTTKALPGENATNYTDAFDLGFTNPVVLWKHAFVLVSQPAATTATGTTATITYTLQDSADNSSFLATTPLIQGRITETATNLYGGLTNTGTAATNFYLPLPPTVRRYIRVQQGVPAVGGTNTTTTNTISVIVP